MAYGTVNADLMTTSDGVSSSGLYGFKNRLINGAMVIDQRNAGASVSNPNTYVPDRWLIETSLSTTTAQQVTDAPAGFSNSVKFTTTTGGSLVSGSYIDIRQCIEGYNVADLNYGTASAQPITVSFWVKSSLTGTFSLNLRLQGQNVGYITNYTINSANTWEQKSITVAGNTSTTLNSNTNGFGITVYFILAAGSTYQSSTLNTWGAVGSGGFGASTTASTAMFTTTGATFYITGVQLEKGSTATSFDYRPYGTELALCQRYYQIFGKSSGGPIAGAYFVRTGYLSYSYGALPFIVQMRTASLSFSWGGGLTLTRFNGAGYTTQTVTSAQLDGSSDKAGNVRVDIASSWTANDAMQLSSDATGYVSISGEL